MSPRGCVKSAKYCSTMEKEEHSFEVCVLGQERNGTFLRRVSHVADLLCGKSRDTGLLCGKSGGDMAQGLLLAGPGYKSSPPPTSGCVGCVLVWVWCGGGGGGG